MTGSLELTASADFRACDIFDSSVRFTISSVFAVSVEPPYSGILTDSPLFIKSHVFTRSDIHKTSTDFTPSSQFISSNAFDQSLSFYPTDTDVPDADTQQSGGALVSAVGGGLAGLAALAILLLFILLKKRKKREEQVEVTEGEEIDTSTIDDENEFVSEYGLSEGIQSLSEDDLSGDLPQPPQDPFFGDSDRANASEVNPNEFDELIFDADEN
jgi:hypothetical protein